MISRPNRYAPLYASLSAAVVIAGILGACGGGKVDAKASGSASTEGEADFDVEGDAAWDQVAADSATSDEEFDGSQTKKKPAEKKTSAAPAATPPALYGARHDLSLASGSAAKCQCLAAAAGLPTAKEFVWRDQAPVIDGQTQLAFALRSHGVSCSEAAPGATYMGYEKRAPDVVVTVEPVVDGHPVTLGAIIPKPEAGGKVIIQGSGKVPYGKPLSGSGSCAIYP